MGQTALGVTLLGPGVAEIEVDAGQAMRGKPLPKFLGVADQEAEIVGAGVGGGYGRFQGNHHHVRDALQGNEVVFGLGGSSADGKATFAAADLKAKRTGFGEGDLRIFPQNSGIGDQKMGTGGNSFRSVLLFSHSHLAICSLIW